MNALQQTIEHAWERRTDLSPRAAPVETRQAVDQVIAGLNDGTLRVAEKIDGNWVTHQWVKKAVLLSFRLEDNVPVSGGDPRCGCLRR